MSDTSAKPAEEIIEQARKLQRELDAAIKRAEDAEALEVRRLRDAFGGIRDVPGGDDGE